MEKGNHVIKTVFSEDNTNSIMEGKEITEKKSPGQEDLQWLSQTSRRVGRAWAQGTEAVGVEGRSKLNYIWQHPDADNEERAWGQSCLLSNSDFLRIFQAIYHLYVIKCFFFFLLLLSSDIKCESLEARIEQSQQLHVTLRLLLL